MRELFLTNQFSKDLAREYKSFSGQPRNGKLRTELALVIGRLMFDVALEDRHKDHALSGDWKGFRDCHVFNDLVLIYRKFDKADKNETYGDHALVLARLGSHSQLDIA